MQDIDLALLDKTGILSLLRSLDDTCDIVVSMNEDVWRATKVIADSLSIKYKEYKGKPPKVIVSMFGDKVQIANILYTLWLQHRDIVERSLSDASDLKDYIIAKRMGFKNAIQRGAFSALLRELAKFYRMNVGTLQNTISALSEDIVRMYFTELIRQKYGTLPEAEDEDGDTNEDTRNPWRDFLKRYGGRR